MGALAGQARPRGPRRRPGLHWAEHEQEPVSRS